MIRHWKDLHRKERECSNPYAIESGLTVVRGMNCDKVSFECASRIPLFRSWHRRRGEGIPDEMGKWAATGIPASVSAQNAQERTQVNASSLSGSHSERNRYHSRE